MYHGPALLLGYEYVSYGGFFLRVELGASSLIDPVRWDPGRRFNPAATLLGLGFKL